MGTRGGGTPPSSTGSPAPTLYTPLLVILFLCTLKCTFQEQLRVLRGPVERGSHGVLVVHRQGPDQVHRGGRHRGQ